MTSPKHFSLVVRVPVSYTKQQANAVGPQWDRLVEQWKNNNVYILSFAFPGEGYVIDGERETVKKEAVLSGDLRVVSNIVLKADNLEDAVELAKQCPTLAHGGSVEVREIPNGVRLA